MESKEFFYEVWPVANMGREISVLTYSHSEKFIVGDLVEIPVGKRRIVGVISGIVSQPKFETKPISRKLMDETLPTEIVELARWISEFYSTSFANVWQTILPSGLLKNRRKTGAESEQKSYSKPEKISLTATQKSALKELRAMNSGTAILRGITGSGKTEIYKNLANDAIMAGKSAIILVPEISLTTQLVNDFRETFANSAQILSTNSAQKETERAKVWQDALTAKRPVVAIGPRSALFLPIQKIGLIVIDEEHEPTYTQDKSPRYNTKTVAAKLIALHTNHADKNTEGAKLILGSATPLVADVFNAKQFSRPIVEMTKLAKTDATPAKISVIDMRRRENFTTESRIFSRKLLEEMRSAIAENKQVLLFHNRRGTSSTTMCEDCGWVANCPNCYLPLTLHADKFELRCHLCNLHEKVPMKCPICASTEILHKGIGTKKIEDEARRLFREIIAKDAKAIRRFDGDTTNAESVASVYDELRNGRTKIIIGTQQIAKGLDLPSLKTVGVVQADTGLNLPDFGARERTFELIAQAVGRVGRHSDKTNATIQTYQPDEPAVIFAKTQDFWGFYDAEIIERERAYFPPFAHLLKITVSYKTEMVAVKNSRKIATSIREKYIYNTKDSNSKIFIMGPSPAFYERLRDNYRWQIVVRGNSRKILSDIANDIAKNFPAKNVTIELDANSLI